MNEGSETEDPLQKRAIWRVLPVHPQPQWLESLSSYVIRLAEANGLQVTDELAALYGMKGRWKGVRLSLDYSSFSFGRLASIAGCTLATLRDTTFYHLARHFACPVMHIPTLYRFFQGSIASSLRYCPGCLAEQPLPYYRLCWRFLAIGGCHHHGCRLLDACGHCAASLPLLPRVPQIAHCVACQGDLRTCSTSLMPTLEGTRVGRRTHDLEMLLMPAEWAPEITSALLLGDGFVLLRQDKQLSTAEVACLMERDEQIILEMEEGNWNGKATFADYCRYIDTLDCSLSQILGAAQLAGSMWRRKPNRLDEIA